MSLIHDLMTAIREDITETVPGLHVTSDAQTIKPALAAGKTVAWVGAPEEITCDGPGLGVARFEIALISPAAANHPKGLDDLMAHALALEPLLGITRMVPETATPGNGPTYPALFCHFETAYQIKE